jgi:Domain of unknown function (DUF4747)
MARDRQFKYSGINIRVHSEHSPSEYKKLWKALYDERTTFTSGPLGIMIGSMKMLDGNNGVTGFFYRFTHIDKSEPWFDSRELKQADPEDVAKVKIPDNLKPGMKQVPYYFDVKSHVLYFISASTDGAIAPRSVNRLLQNVSSREAVIDIFGKVDLTTIMDEMALDQALRWPRIKKIELMIEKPNPSDYDDEAEVFKRMKKQHLSREQHIYTIENKAATIVVDETIKDQIHVAKKNGHVDITGVNNAGILSTMSSEKYPMQRAVSYDPDQQLLIDALIERAKS